MERHIKEYDADQEEARLLSVPVDALEAVFMSAVVRYAKFWGWTVYHTHRSQFSAKGFPDLAMYRREPALRVVMAELKRKGKRPTSEQNGWLLALREITATYVWDPTCLTEIVEILR